MTKDLTVGKSETVLWKFCLPLFGSVLFQQLYNIADSLVAGKYIGEDALAAVGNSYEITLIFIAFAFGCNIGCSVVVSQLFGAKDYKTMKTAVSTTMIFSGIMCISLMIFGLFFCRPLLELIHTPENIMNDSALYLDIYIWGLPFLYFYNISTGIFSALGDSKTPFLFLAVSSSANIVMDIIFVKYFSLGIAGVAWATFLCQGISCILALVVVLKRLKSIHSEKPDIFSKDCLRRIARIAIPSILQQSFISIGNIMIQGTINGYGSSVVAGYAAAVKLNNMIITSFTTIGNGISNFTAQNIGAGIYTRVREGFRAGIKMVWMISIPIVTVYLLFREYLVGFFMNEPSKTALETGMIFLCILAPCYFIVSAKLVADGILRGAGLMKYFMIATLTDLALRVILANVFSGIFGATGIWLSWPVGWIVSTGLSLTFYHKSNWGRKQIEDLKSDIESDIESDSEVVL